MVKSATSPDEPPTQIFFCSCGHPKSEQYCEELEKHFACLIREKPVIIWQSHQILAGVAYMDEIIHRVRSADIIVLCISTSLFSDEYWGIMELAMELRDKRRVYVIPIYASPYDYKATRLRELQVLPRRRKKALSQLSRSDREAAYAEIAKEIRKIVQNLQVCSSQEEKVTEEGTDRQSDSNDPAFYKAQGDKFFQQKQYDEAIAAYDEVISLDSKFVDALRAKAEVRCTLASLNYEKLHEMLKRLSEQFPNEMDPPNDTEEDLEK